jgi:hypothetical protein
MYGIIFSLQCTSSLLVSPGLKLVKYVNNSLHLNCWYFQISLIGTSGIAGSYVELRAWWEVCRSEPWNHQWAEETYRSLCCSSFFPFFSIATVAITTGTNMFLNIQLCCFWAHVCETCRFCSFQAWVLLLVQVVSVVCLNEVCINIPLPLHLQLWICIVFMDIVVIMDKASGKSLWVDLNPVRPHSFPRDQFR